MIMNPQNLQQQQNSQSNTEYGQGNENDSSIKFETKAIKSSLCDYPDAYILVTGSITAVSGNGNTSVALKNMLHLRDV